MSKRYASLLRPVLVPSFSPWLFLLGTLLLAILSNALYDLISGVLPRLWMVIVIILVAIGLIVLIPWAIQRYFRPILDAGLSIRPRRGLVVLVSQGKPDESSALAAIRYHYRGEKDERSQPVLQHCWLVTTPKEPSASTQRPGVQSAWENAEQFAEQFRALIDMHIIVVEPNDPEDVYEKVSGALKDAQRRGLPSREVVADCTGGTKMMTVGMALAATTMRYSLEYMKARALNAQGYAVASEGSDPLIIDLQYVVGGDAD